MDRDEGGGTVLLDERDLWPDGEFVTTHLVVATELLEENEPVVRALVEGLVDAVEAANGDTAAAQQATNDGIERITTKRLPDATIAGACDNLTFTVDPIAESLEESKGDAVALGLLDDVDLEGIYDLTVLNEVLEARGDDSVEGL